MKKILTAILIFVSPGILTAQQSEGDKLRSEGDLEGAIRAYRKAYSESPADQKNTYSLASTIALLYQMPDSAFHYLDLALKTDSSLWVLADTDMISLKEDTRWKGIEQQQLRKYQKANGPLKDPEYARELLSMIGDDQALDYYIDMAKAHFAKNGIVPHWYYPLGKMKSQIGAGNFERLQQLLQEKGWPNYSKVGELAADALLLAINHHESDEVRELFIDQIKSACEAGEGSCMEYAKIQDRILVNKGELQIYGMQFRYGKDRKLEPFPVENPEYVDQRRTAIGLEPLKVYLKRKINFDWTIEQKK
ncbi:MAG: hypothetical protein HEP71_34345 [Roseivirga sp.]|nr:hypothetical protein [Roseivirga sp.]